MGAEAMPAQTPPHPPRRVGVYIDGFNLYYGSLKGTPYKWLDPYALACALMPSDGTRAARAVTAATSLDLRLGPAVRRAGDTCPPP